jgi:hypothetical protein
LQHQTHQVGDPNDHNPFADSWQESLLADYRYKFVSSDANAEASFRSVLIEAGMSESSVMALHNECLDELDPDSRDRFLRRVEELDAKIARMAISKASRAATKGKSQPKQADLDPLASVSEQPKPKKTAKNVVPAASKGGKRRRANDDAKGKTNTLF